VLLEAQRAHAHRCRTTPSELIAEDIREAHGQVGDDHRDDAPRGRKRADAKRNHTETSEWRAPNDTDQGARVLGKEEHCPPSPATSLP